CLLCPISERGTKKESRAIRIIRSWLELRRQPRPRKCKIPLNGRQRDPQHHRRFGFRKTAKKSQLQNAVRSTVYLFQPSEDFVKLSDIGLLSSGPAVLFAERDPDFSKAVLRESHTAGVIHQDVAQFPGRECEEMRPILPVDAHTSHQLDVELVNQCSG